MDGNYTFRSFSRSPNKPEAADLLGQIVRSKVVVGPTKVDGPISLYGAGALGRLAKEYFDCLGIRYDAVIDQNKSSLSNDPFWETANLLHPAQIKAEQKITNVLALCIVTQPVVPLISKLKKEGWLTIIPFYDIAEAHLGPHPVRNGWFAGALKPKEIKQISEVLLSWDDNISRSHFLQMLAWRCNRWEWSFLEAPVNVQNRYFIPEVLSAFDGDISFLDIGGHHGSVSQKVIEMFPGNKKIWIVEGDKYNFEKLEELLVHYEAREKVSLQVIPYVLSKYGKEEAFLDGYDFASQISEKGKKIRTRTIDQLNLQPSFVKIHIEGKELEVLEGGIETIRRHRPVIAMTCYHNSEILWYTIKRVKGLLYRYKILFRLHSWCGTGAVVYAIPLEKFNIQAL